MSRVSWDEYFMRIAGEVASDRVIETARQVGIDVWFWLPGSDE